ncbi:hypothetical protein BH11PAT1_BH11PAT1_1290 [soil metagenome]
MVNKIFIVSLFIVFLALSVYLFLQEQPDIRQKITFFYQSEKITDMLKVGTPLDGSTQPVLLTRLFHNKLLASIDIFSQNISRDVDPVYLFGLSGESSSIYGGYGKALSLIEFPLFIFSIIYFLRNGLFHRKKYFFLIPLTSIAILTCGFFVPVYHPLKILPLVIIIQTMIFISFHEFFKKILWLSK